MQCERDGKGESHHGHHDAREDVFGQLLPELFGAGMLDDAEQYRFDLVALQCDALPGSVDLPCVREKTFRPGFGPGRNASEGYAVGCGLCPCKVIVPPHNEMELKMRSEHYKRILLGSNDVRLRCLC